MNSLKYLNKYLYKYRGRILLGILCVIVSNFFGVLMPRVLGDAVNTFKEQVADHLPANEILWNSLKIGGLYIGLNILKGLFLFFTRQTLIIMSRLAEYDLKNEIYTHYQKLDFAFYKNHRIGDLMNRISEDVTQVRMYLGPGLMYNLNLLVLFPLCIYWMMQTNVKLTFIVLSPLPILSFIIYKVSSKINLASKLVQEEQSHISTLAQEYFSGIRVIKAYLRQEHTTKTFNDAAEEYKKRNMKMVLINAFFMPSITFLIALSVILSVYIGSLYTYTGDIKVGDIIAFIMYVNMLTWPFASVGWVTSIIQRASASQTRINEFLQAEPEIVNTSNETFETIESIEFKDVDFTYKNSGITALHDLNFKINKGEKIGIIGKTGSGKSTILYLLTRQFDSSNGEVLVNGKSIKETNLDAYQKQIGIVPQEVFLFSDTIANNIAFGIDQEKATKEAIENAAKQADVYDNIMEFTEQFDTELGERGINLSGGQKQRVSIARALIREPELLLLDDCLSAVDTETEEEILHQLAQLKKQTVVIVSHRISSLRLADKIFVLDNGHIVESGSHEELLAKGGAYYGMYLKQLAEEKVANERENKKIED